MTETRNVTGLPQWQALEAHQRTLQDTHMRDLFRQDPQRAERYSASAAGFTLDYSKNRITDETLEKLLGLAEARKMPEAIANLFGGGAVNTTEKRPALHVALRDPSTEPLRVNGEDIRPEISRTLARMEDLVWRVRSHQWRGFSGIPFTDVVSIGIGGSYLGPKLVAEALRPYWLPGLQCHYVANIDGTDVAETLKELDPETTLFLMQSKSFRTQETLENTTVARDWFLRNGGSEAEIERHFVAVTANTPAAIEFGIAEKNVFPMWDWVGGRYSLWSAIGLPIALTLGMDNFRALLAGAHAMDEHFRTARLSENLPVIMGLLGVWYGNFWGADAHTVLPYDHYLRGLPAHLQQLDMESNGKCVTHDGTAVNYQTGPILWGGAGANGQHAYHQLLHQGTKLSPADFIIPLHSHNPVANHHATLFANCLSQSQALMQGKTEQQAREELKQQGLSATDIDRLAPHKVIPGNKPSNTLLFERATPEAIGALVVLYEHRTYVQGVIWDINSFDQWGVELGKQLGQGILGRLLADDETAEDRDSSTERLISLFRSRHG